MYEFFQYITNMGETILNYFSNAGSYFDAAFVWLQAWWIKMKFMVMIEFLRISYLVATTLLDEIGFSSYSLICLTCSPLSFVIGGYYLKCLMGWLFMPIAPLLHL